MNTLNSVLSVYEAMPSIPLISTLAPLRKWGIEAAYQQVIYSDENTNCQTVGPVSSPLNMVARFAHGDSEAVKTHYKVMDDFMWMSESGLMSMGTNGSQTWDIGFIAQALVETGLADEAANRESVEKALEWMDKAQIRDDAKWHEKSYRHRSKGAWAFSTPEQSFTVCFRLI